MEVVLACLIPWSVACGDARTPTEPVSPPRAAADPAPVAPRPVPSGPHDIQIFYDPDNFNEPVLQDAEGNFPLVWGRLYCLWIQNIPETPTGHCRTYNLTFGWHAAGVTGSGRGCQSYPNRINPGQCFSAPDLDAVDPRQTIAITAIERFPDGRDTEVFRKEVGIRLVAR